MLDFDQICLTSAGSNERIRSLSFFSCECAFSFFDKANSPSGTPHRIIRWDPARVKKVTRHAKAVFSYSPTDAAAPHPFHAFAPRPFSTWPVVFSLFASFSSAYSSKLACSAVLVPLTHGSPLVGRRRFAATRVHRALF